MAIEELKGQSKFISRKGSFPACLSTVSCQAAISSVHNFLFDIDIEIVD